VLDGGTLDPQKPHFEDEVYYVASGRGRMRMEADGEVETFQVGPGTIIFVPARMRHSFYDITERLAVLVFFGPAEHSGIAKPEITSLS
jgi:mannose-6-phosphate isomerase-like protein (cupin superfamily)